MSDDAYEKAIEISRDKAIEVLSSLGYQETEAFDLMVDRLAEKILDIQIELLDKD